MYIVHRLEIPVRAYRFNGSTTYFLLQLFQQTCAYIFLFFPPLSLFAKTYTLGQKFTRYCFRERFISSLENLPAIFSTAPWKSSSIDVGGGRIKEASARVIRLEKSIDRRSESFFRDKCRTRTRDVKVNK